MRFRPCIDIHNGRVKQIVGATLRDESALATNFETEKPAADYARLYRADGLTGGHIAMLGSGNHVVAREALQNYPDGLQIGGGITAENANQWIGHGAQAVIVTSYLFDNARFDHERLENISEKVGRKRLVLDLSCRRIGDRYVVMTDRWQRETDLQVDSTSLQNLFRHCSEFLIHAVDFEGLSGGIDRNLVELLGSESPCPTTYAGGISSYGDIDSICELGKGRIDYTVGSALDIFGGSKLAYADLIAE